MLWLSLFCINTFLLGESIEMEFVVDGTHPWQLCRSCDYIAQSLAGLIHNWLLLLVVDINTKSHDGCCRLRLFGGCR